MKKRMFSKKEGSLYFPFRYVSNGTIVYIMKDSDNGSGNEHNNSNISNSYNFCIRKVCCGVSCDFKVSTYPFLLSPVTKDATGLWFNIIDSDKGIDITGSRFTIKEVKGDLCVCSASGDFFNFRVKLPEEALKEYFAVVSLLTNGIEV